MGPLKKLCERNSGNIYRRFSVYRSVTNPIPSIQNPSPSLSPSFSPSLSPSLSPSPCSSPSHRSILSGTSSHNNTARSALQSYRQVSSVGGPVTQDVAQLAEVAEVATSNSSIKSREITINRTLHPQVPRPLQDLKFGIHFTDHMLSVSWDAVGGWSQPAISPLGPIPMHPCAQVLHYGLECFEGMKAYSTKDEKICLFRPDRNMARLASSCLRLNLPDFDQEELLACIKALLREDKDWVPKPEGFSMYIRPTCISTTPFLGIGPPKNALMFVVLCPVGPYFPEGLKPISLFVDTKNVRACKGGVGDKKVGGNYGPTILPQVEAAKKGCSQVLYVLENEKGEGLIGESGAMNVFFLMKREGVKGGRELVTPNLDGLILPGVTRDSVLEIIKSWDEFEVSERPITLEEVKEAHAAGRLEEIFGTGTAVVVQPVSKLLLPDGKLLELPYDEEATLSWSKKLPGKSLEPRKVNEPFNVSGRAYRAIMDIQYGHIPSPWSVPIDD